MRGVVERAIVVLLLEFTIEPSDAVVPEGSSVLLQCAGRTHKQALHIKDGKSSPNIRWRGPDGQDIGIVGDTFRTQLTNGSLYISSVDENRGLTGAYQCLLSVDGIGTIVSRSARLTIAALPEVNQESNEIYLFLGQTAYLKCISSLSSINGHGYDYNIQWLKNDVPLRFDDTRMLILPSGSLEIDELTAQDRGTYQCNVTFKNYLRSSSKSNLNIKSPSGMPESFAPPSFAIVPVPQTVKEGDRVIFDCVANGNPKPVVKWLRNGEDIDFNDLDSRFRIIGTGSLQITSVEDGDSSDYQCRASNTVDSLDASATLNVQVPPKFIQSPSDKIANEKDELELVCSMHGKPTPVIQWLKNGDLITPNEYMQIVGGHNLKILGLIGSDAGMFQCIGNNPAGSVQATAHLEITSAKKSKSQNKKQFLPLSSSSPTKKPQKNDVKLMTKQQKFQNSRAEDDNFHTSKIVSKQVLDSLRSKDKSTKPVAADHRVYDNSDYFDKLNHQEDSDDDPEEDYDDEEEEEEDDLTVHRLGPDVDPKILLHSLTSSKHNHHSDSTDSDDVAHFSNTQIIPITRKYPTTYVEDRGSSMVPLPGPPRAVQAQIIKPRFVTLNWLEPVKNPDEVVSYTVFYKMNTSNREQKINTKSRDEQEVNIQSLLPGKTYHFRVVGNSNHGPGESSEKLEIVTQPEENIAGPPQNLNGKATAHNEIELKWEIPLVTNGVISKYRVFYAEGENGESMYADTISTEIVLTELKAYSEYIISVVPWNQNGMGDTSSEILVKTFSSIPSEAPNNITLEASSSTSIIIRWESPPEEFRNGQITGYKIKYRKMKKAVQVETTPGNVRFHELKNLERMSAYQIKISAMTVNGSGPFTEWSHIETYENDLDETQVPGQPGWIKTRPNADSIAVSWGVPAQQDIKVRGFILGWGKGIPDEETFELEENTRYYEIKSLEPNSEYVISLRARNLVGDGPPIYDTVRTREETAIEAPSPLEVPVGLRAIPMSGTSIVVYWTDTTLSKSQHVTDNRHYVVRYSSTGATRHRYHNTTDLNSMISELRPNTQYEFEVKVVKGRRESSWSMSVINTTMSAAPASPPRDLLIKIDDNTPLSVLLQWQPPKQTNGPILNYVILYTTESAKRDRDWLSENVPAEKTSAIINNLKPHMTYYFKVQTKHAKGLGPFSAMVSHTTGTAAIGTNESASNVLLTNEVLYMIIGGMFLLVIIIIIVLALIFCRRKPQETPEHQKKSYQKNNVGIIKPPDLWIHHDQMELKNMEKPNMVHSTTPGCSDGASSSGAMTLPRSVGHDFEGEMTHVTNSLDTRNYVPGYMSGSMNSSASERPHYPRTQYNIQRPPHISQMDPSLSPENPYAYDVVPANYSNPNVTYAGLPVDPNLIPKNHRGHPLKSFSIPAPPSCGTPIGHKQTPAVTIRPQNSSPYKKSATTTPSTANRLQSGPLVAHSNDEVQRLQPSTSTEELNQEMANLEGLMKDLSAITASEFEC
ncbi:unnamed protein product [Diamesa hyperborea]